MIATTVLALGIGVLIMVLVRRDRMHGAYAVWWAFVAFAIMLLGLFPRVVDRVGRELGVAYPPMLILVVAVCLLFLKILTMDIERSRQEAQLRRLAQRLSVLERLYEELRSEDQR